MLMVFPVIKSNKNCKLTGKHPANGIQGHNMNLAGVANVTPSKLGRRPRPAPVHPVREVFWLHLVGILAG